MQGLTPVYMVNLIVATVVVVLSACAATKGAKVSEADYSGFLGDYSMLSEGEHSALQYKNPNIRPGNYINILLDPVTVWRGNESKAAGVPQADIQRLADYFYTLVYDKLSQDYEIVKVPAPRTMRIGVALVNLQESNVTLDVISNIAPPARLLSEVREYITGKAAFVGEASIEVKIKDAESGELLAAGVDRRVGGKTLTANSFNSWGDVEAILEFWVDRFRYRLCKAREGTGCALPQSDG